MHNVETFDKKDKKIRLASKSKNYQSMSEKMLRSVVTAIIIVTAIPFCTGDKMILGIIWC